MLLSVVIPVYNEKNTVLEMLAKVEAVEGINKEIIIVDDPSTDGTVDILKKLQKEKPGIKFLFPEVNQGKGASLRDGFKQTSGDYVIVQDVISNTIHKITKN